jgi:DNA-binding NarL/FixJ family response regulator
MTTDDVAILEAAYRLDLDDRAWQRGILTAARAELDAGFGVFAYQIDARDLGAVRASAPVLVGGPAGGEEVIAQIDAALALAPEQQRELGIVGPAEMASQLYAGTHAVVTASSTVGRARFRALPAVQRWLAPFGVGDLLVVKTIDVDRRGLVIGAALPSPTTPARGRTIAWSRIAAHLAAAVRLRRRRRAEQPLDLGGPAGTAGETGATEAIFDEALGVAHASGEARETGALEALRRAAAAIVRARGRLRRDDPEGALAMWPSLVDGRWTLLDCFDRDGKRFLVAQRNEPSVDPRLALTPRERQVAAHAAIGHGVRLIAYELGLAPATVCEQLRSAMQKLGVSTRAELAAAYHLATLPEAALARDAELTVLSIPRRAREAESRLSPGERAIVEMIERGRSNADIAAARGTSTHTVANQIARLFRKLGVGSRAELASWSVGV